MRSLRGQSAARHAGHARHLTADDSILNTSIGSMSESGYEGDMEDEGDVNVDEELCSELADDQHGVLNKQSRDSSFLNWEEFSRTSSTPSILHPAGTHNSGFDFEVQDMDTEPVPMDNGIHSSSELCVPVVLEADDNMELGEGCAKPLESSLRRRQPLRPIENNSNLSVRDPISWKSQRRISAWSRTVPH